MNQSPRAYSPAEEQYLQERIHFLFLGIGPREMFPPLPINENSGKEPEQTKK
jgi:hypothetical protein